MWLGTWAGSLSTPCPRPPTGLTTARIPQTVTDARDGDCAWPYTRHAAATRTHSTGKSGAFHRCTGPVAQAAPRIRQTMIAACKQSFSVAVRASFQNAPAARQLAATTGRRAACQARYAALSTKARTERPSQFGANVNEPPNTTRICQCRPPMTSASPIWSSVLPQATPLQLSSTSVRGGPILFIN